jgi:hypothetical protein
VGAPAALPSWSLYDVAESRVLVADKKASTDCFARLCLHLDAWLARASSQPSMLSCSTKQTDLLCPVMPAAIVEAAEIYAMMLRYVRRENVVCTHLPLPNSASAT